MIKCLFAAVLMVFVSFGTKSQLAITEFISNPNNSDDDREWIELYNYSSSTVNLKGWKIKGKGGLEEIDITTTDFFVPSGGYVILASNKTVFERERRTF